MRLLILAAGAALTLAGCGNDDQADTGVNADQALTAESIVTNDVTAIDAVTSDAANMAADVDINFTNELLEPSGNASGAAKRAPRPGEAAKAPPRPRTPAPDAAPKDEPANTTENSTE